MKLIEKDVTEALAQYLESRGLDVIGKFSTFTHADDKYERSFETDLAIGPKGTAGNRSEEAVAADSLLFAEHATVLGDVMNDLVKVSLFPNTHTSIKSWRWEANPNPVVGIAVEVENEMSKYFLGSLLASAIVGRWGIVIIPDVPEAPRWIETIHRVMHKGPRSPIPSNVAIFTWPTLKAKIDLG